MKRSLAVISLAVMAVSLAVMLSGMPACAQEKQVVKIIGSKYCYFTIEDWAGIFRADNQTINVDVKPASVYSVTEALQGNEADAVMLFGRIQEDEVEEAQENGIQLEEQVIGEGAVTFVTYRDNPINALTVDQIRKIFLGEIVNWKEVGGENLPIEPISRNEAMSGTHDYMVNNLLQGYPVGQNVLRIFHHDVVRTVWKTKGSIADARLTEGIRGSRKGMVKVLAVKATNDAKPVLPSLSTIRNRTYPVTGPLTLYYNPATLQPPAKQFVQFCSNKSLSVVRFTKREEK